MCASRPAGDEAAEQRIEEESERRIELAQAHAQRLWHRVAERTG